MDLHLTAASFLRFQHFGIQFYQHSGLGWGYQWAIMNVASVPGTSELLMNKVVVAGTSRGQNEACVPRGLCA